ncbi:MAG: TonB family protein, partial [Proteobacteria bacterium]|nr:TonB family protein [Pseudomonadota bacterium]
LFNILLFSALPLLVQRGFNKSGLETIIPVNIIQLKRPSSPPPEKKKEELQEKKKLEEVIPNVRLKLQKRVIPQRPEIESPQLTFEINPKLTVGMAVTPPPKGPAVFSPKESYLQGEVDQMPIPVFRMEPVYPYRARRLRVFGEVKVKFLVDERGHVGRVKILSSRPAGVFDKSVLKALPSWKFSPGKVRGNAVSTWVVTTIEFKMGG